MDNTKNALAKLASRLNPDRMTYDDLDMAQRIVAELARVYAIKCKLESKISTEAIDELPKAMKEWMEADGRVVDRCRVIAEEGGEK